MKSMSKTLQIIIGIIIIVVIIVLVVVFSGKETIKGTLKIGTILPLTGDLATYAEGAHNAVKLAIENSGFRDKIQLIVEDDMGCQPKDAVSAAQKLINIDKVEAIIGAVCSNATLAIAPLTEQAKMVLISPSATSKSITNAGDYIFRVIASDADKSIAVAKFAYEQGYKKAALLYDIANDSFIQQRIDAEEMFKELGGEIVIKESFITKDKDFRTQLAKIKNSDAEIVFIGAFPKEGGLVFKQAADLGIKLTFISTETSLGTQDVVDIAKDSADGLIFPFATTPDNKEHTEFINAYKAKYGQDAPAYAAESYDVGMLLIKALAKSDRTPESIKDELQKIGQNYYGASGIITFDENGDVQKPMIIKTIKDGQFVEVE